jgi:phosphopantetheine adenylyltransferase
VAIICAEKSIASDLEADDPGAVDVRIVLIDHDRFSASEYEPSPNGLYEPNTTPVLDLAAFASTVHPWKHIFHTSSEGGYQLLTTYLKYAEGRQRILQSQLIAVDGGLSVSTSTRSQDSLSEAGSLPKTIDSPQLEGPIKNYTTVCLGGTFDHLHPGHKLFLHAAILLLDLAQSTSEERSPCELVVGISSDELLAKKKYAEQLQSWDIRCRSVIRFLSTLLNSSTTLVTKIKALQAETKEAHASFRNGAILVRCVDFHDLYGPTTKEEKIQALVVSGETRGGGQAVNDKRRSQGWSILDVYEIDVLDASIDPLEGAKSDSTATGFEGKISSTEIRKQKAERASLSTRL